MPSCLECGSEVGDYDSGYYSRNMLCFTCYTRKASEIRMTNCNKCGMRIRQDEARSRSGGLYCNYCFSELERIERMPVCEICQKRIESFQPSLKNVEGQTLHADCAQKKEGKRVVARCSFCRGETDHFKLSRDGRVMCFRCSSMESRKRGQFSPAAARAGNPLISLFVDKIARMIC